MKLGKLVKMQYKDLVEYSPQLKVPHSFEIFESGFDDGITNTVLAMQNLGVHIAVIKQILNELDPKGESFAYWLIIDEYNEYIDDLCMTGGMVR